MGEATRQPHRNTSGQPIRTGQVRERHPEGCKTFAERFPRHFIILLRKRRCTPFEAASLELQGRLQHRVFESNLPKLKLHRQEQPPANDNIRLPISGSTSGFRNVLRHHFARTPYPSPGRPGTRARAPQANWAGGASVRARRRPG